MAKSKTVHPVTQFALDAVSGVTITNKWVRLACKRHLSDLEHGKKRGLWFDEAAATNIIEFYPEFLTFYEGAFDGVPFNLTPIQKFIVGSLFGWKHIDTGNRRFKIAYIEMAKGQGKALSLDTKIPTPTGWTTIGDVGIGDMVFDEKRMPCTVINKTEIMYNRPCFCIKFSNGEKITADAGHLWKINFNCPGGFARGMFFTTQDIYDSLNGIEGWGCCVLRNIDEAVDIVECVAVDTVPVKCIEVDSESHLYLVGEDSVPTHNSPLAAGIGLYGLVFDDESSAEIYSSAVTKEQAGILFRDARLFAEGSPELSGILEVGQHNIAYIEKNSFFRALSSEHRGLDGKRPHIALIDEIHEHPNDLVVRKMSLGTKGRRSPLIAEFTNSGYDRTSICYQHHEYTVKVLENVTQDDTWFGLMTGLDVCEACERDGKTVPTDGCPNCDDWRDESTWIKANPNLPYLGSAFNDYLKQQVSMAISIPAHENLVKRLNFCIWTESSTKWMSQDLWNRCSFPVDAESLRGRKCYGGLDLSDTTDLTAFVLVFPPEDQDGVYQVVCKFYLPKDNMHERMVKHRMPYDVWERQGLITLTPGNFIDDEFVIEDIRKATEAYDIQELAYDAWGSSKIVKDLENIGFQTEKEDKPRLLVKFRQGDVSMSPPMKDLEKLILSRSIAHGGNPVLGWMFSNMVVSPGPTGLIKPDKQKSSNKIDGVVALIMAIGRAVLCSKKFKSVYEDRGVLVF